MRYSALLALSAAAFGGEARYARVGEAEGQVEAQARGGGWRPALRNMPVAESFWVRTADGARVEIEMDDGAVLRLGPQSLAEFSDYSRLSTGQSITLLSIDRGLAYFTGEPAERDATILSIPGAQINVRRGSRLRLEVNDEWGQVSVFEGQARVISPAAELDVQEGQVFRLGAARRDKFYLYREITALDADTWSEERDKVLAAANLRRLPWKYGMADLDAAGTWIESASYGTVWKPAAQEGWAPFRNGKWLWYEGLGYTWISADAWGWLPYHHGRWIAGGEALGWLWVPAKSSAFLAGEAYWMRAPGLAGWGPLAPGESWKPGAGPPRSYLSAHSTFARFAPEAWEIVPDAAVAPKDPLAGMAFAAALPAVTAVAGTERPALRVGATRVVPLVAGVACEAPAAASAPSSVQAYVPETLAAAPAPAPMYYVPPAPAAAAPAPPVAPADTYYVAPVYTGVVVLNPPERHQRRPAAPKPAQEARRTPEPKPAATPPAPPAPAAPRVPRIDSARPGATREPEAIPREDRVKRNNQ